MLASAELFSVYQKAEGLLAEGDLRQAADLCKTLLDADPAFPYGYHLMSTLFHATGTIDQALNFAQMAVKIAPDVAAFRVQEGKLLLAVSAWKEAGEAFQKAHHLEPKNPHPLLLWADSMRKEGRFDEALVLVAQARAVADIPEIDEFEGACLMVKGELTQAEHCFDRLVHRLPKRYESHLNKGRLLFRMNRLLEAEGCFARALKIHPQGHEALYYMAMLNNFQGYQEIAVRYAMLAIQAQPQYWDGHVLLGSLLLGHSKNDAAEYVLQQAQAFLPDDVYLTQLLMTAMRRQGKLPEALAQLEALLAVRPDNNVLRYFCAMLKGQNAEAAPLEYIASLFNSCAEQYEQNLKQIGANRIPAQMAEMVFDINQDAALRLLDLGCGTGLAAEAFRHITRERVGVDLAEKMVEQARGKQLYSELHVLPMVEFMTGCDRLFDLVVASDVLTHTGNITPFLKAARNVLAAEGLLLFSVETLSSPGGYRLHASGGFTHDTQYIHTMVREEGYRIERQEDLVVRMEQITPIFGSIFALRKLQMH